MSDEDLTLVDQVPRTLRSEVRVAADEANAPRTPTLTVVTGPSPGRFVAIPMGSRAIFIGRDEGCDLYLDDPSVSRRHARVYFDPQPGLVPVVYIQDLESTNGTVVNGDGVHRSVLGHGDRVHIGDILLRFEMLDTIDIAYRDGVARQVEESERDPLTGLMRRSAMKDYLPELVERCQAHKVPLSAVMLDLDHFKQINDTLGHAAGDEVLRRSGAIVNDTIRKDDLAIRYGGEEFLLILAGARRLHARLLAERLREAIAATRFDGLAELKVTASLGVGELAEGETVAQWIERTDKALYRAKDRGRNRSEAAPRPRES